MGSLRPEIHTIGWNSRELADSQSIGQPKKSMARPKVVETSSKYQQRRHFTPDSPNVHGFPFSCSISQQTQINNSQTSRHQRNWHPFVATPHVISSRKPPKSPWAQIKFPGSQLKSGPRELQRGRRDLREAEPSRAAGGKGREAAQNKVATQKRCDKKAFTGGNSASSTGTCHWCTIRMGKGRKGIGGCKENLWETWVSSKTKPSVNHDGTSMSECQNFIVLLEFPHLVHTLPSN